MVNNFFSESISTSWYCKFYRKTKHLPIGVKTSQKKLQSSVACYPTTEQTNYSCQVYLASNDRCTNKKRREAKQPDNTNHVWQVDLGNYADDCFTYIRNRHHLEWTCNLT